MKTYERKKHPKMYLYLRNNAVTLYMNLMNERETALVLNNWFSAVPYKYIHTI